MRTRIPSNLAALTTVVAVVVAVVVAWSSPAAAVAPTFTGPTTVSVVTNVQTNRLLRTGAPQVVDADSSSVSLQLVVGGIAVGRPTFTLDGTTGLTVTGSPTRSGEVTVLGTPANINAALDGMNIHAGAPSTEYTLTLTADDTPGTVAGQVSRVITIDQQGTSPRNTMPSTFVVGPSASKQLVGAAAPRVTDDDSPILAVEFNIGAQSQSTGVPAAERPTFTLDGTTGLTLDGPAVNVRTLRASGTIANLNAAMDGMTINGGPTEGGFRLVVETQDVVEDGAGNANLADTDFVNFDVEASPPDVQGVTVVSLGTWSNITRPPITFVDPDSPTLEVNVTIDRIAPDTTSVRPTFSLSTTAGLTVVSGSSTNSTFVKLVGSIANLNAALSLATITATSDPGQFRFGVTAQDNPGGSGGLADSDAAAINVTDEAPTVVVPDATVGAHAQTVLAGSRAPSVADADDTAVEVLVEVLRRAGDTTSVRPTFTLDGTTGLGVSDGTASNSTRVVISGAPAAINAALDGMTLTGGPAAGLYDLRLTVDEAVGAATGPLVTRVGDLRVTAVVPTATTPPDFTMSVSTDRTLSGASAPTVADADSPIVDAIVTLLDASLGVAGARFSLDGTAGLTVTAGSAVNASTVNVTGTLAAINAALDGMVILGSPLAESADLFVRVDDAPGAPAGRIASDTTRITVTANSAVSIPGTDLSVGTHSSSGRLTGPAAPQVSDADSAVLDVVISTTASGGVPEAERPTFTLDGTAGLTVVTGSATASRNVRVQGSPAALNAALDGIVVRGGATAGGFGINVTVDDVPGAGGVTDSAVTQVTATDAAPTVTVPTTAPHAHPGQTRDVAVTAADADSAELEARVRVLGTAAGRPKVKVTAPAGLVVDAGPVTGTLDLQVHGPKAAVISALASMQVVAGATTGTFTVEVVVDDARPEVGNTVTRTFTVVVDPPPSAPTSVTAAARPGAVVAAWAPPSAPGPNAITGYRVRLLRGTTQVATVELAPSARSHTFTGVANGTAVTVEVRALTAIGPGGTATAGPVTPQVFLPFASAAAMVDRLYLDLLGRAPSSAERAAAVAALGDGSVKPADLVAQLRGSTDNTGNVDPVTRLYRAYFLRIPDQGGLDFWIARRRSGQGLNQISASFAASPEFTTLYGALSNQEFVELVYENVLGRPGAPGEVAFWTDQLDTGVRTRGRVMTGFSESPEYRTAQRAEVDVSVAYIALLGRRPTNTEHALGVAALEAGSLTLAALHTSILESDEYRSQVAG